MTQEIDNAINWIEGAGKLILPFYPKEQISHQVIWADRIFENIRAAIKQGNTDAVKLGCKLIIDDPKIPFGKAIKSSIARALKAQAALIDASSRERIVRKTITLLQHPFIPREVKEYCKLIKHFDIERYQNEIESIDKASENKYAQKLITYLWNHKETKDTKIRNFGSIEPSMLN